jgi:hypothetical protein
MLQYAVTGIQPNPRPTLGLFGVQIGVDTSNNFGLSVDGMAVRTPSGRFVAMAKSWDGLVDVTAFVIPINAMIYRLPTAVVKRGDLIVTADPPNFSALYVLSTHDPFEIEGLDIGSAQVIRYRAPRNPFFNFYAKVVSVWDLIGL